MTAGDEIVFKLATDRDGNRLTDLIRQYYASDQIPFVEAEIRSGLAAFLNDPSLGRAWLIMRERQSIGYVILTFGADLELGGRIGIITDHFGGKRARRAGRRTGR